MSSVGACWEFIQKSSGALWELVGSSSRAHRDGDWSVAHWKLVRSMLGAHQELIDSFLGTPGMVIQGMEFQFPSSKIS